MLLIEQGTVDTSIETRFLTIHLFYTENCPPEYCPPGFQPNHELDMLVPDTEDWKLQRADVGTMDSGFYRLQSLSGFWFH